MMYKLATMKVHDRREEEWDDEEWEFEVMGDDVELGNARKLVYRKLLEYGFVWTWNYIVVPVDCLCRDLSEMMILKGRYVIGF